MKQPGFRIENSEDGTAVSLPNRLDNNPLAVLVPRQATITAMCFDVADCSSQRRRTGAARPILTQRVRATTNTSGLCFRH
jgi:hypothetical protein